MRFDRAGSVDGSARSVVEVLGTVVPDRAALPTLGADGTLVAMSVRVRMDSRPRHAGGFLPTPEGLPVEAALGQRVRVWRVCDGTWFDPFAAWTASWGGSWSPDGQLLAAFVHRGHQAPSVAVWNSAEDEMHNLDVLGAPFFTFERPQWVLGGAGLVVETLPEAMGSTSVEPAEADLVVSVLCSHDDRPPRTITMDSADLTLIEVSGNRRLLARDWTVRSWRASPQGDRIGCLRLTHLATDEHQIYFDLDVIDLHSGETVTPARRICQSYGLGWSWSPDGAQIAYLVTGRCQTDELWVVRADAKTPPRRVTDGNGLWPQRGSSDERGGYQAPRWLDQGTVIWHREGFGFVTVSLGTTEVMVTPTPHGQQEQWLQDVDDPVLSVSADGSFRSVCAGAGAFRLDQVRPRTGERITLARYDGSVSTSQLQVGGWSNGGAFLVGSASQPGEVWLGEHDEVRRLAKLNPALSPVHTARRLSWALREEQLAAGLLVPLGPTPPSGWPLVISVYGGARTSRMVEEYDPDNGILNASLLTSRGWAVMFPDLPISDRDPMNQFAAMVRSGLDNVPHGLVDPRRIAVIGNSYGSYTVLSLLVTMPGTFIAAAISAPLVNPLASYGSLNSDGVAYDGFWERGQGRMGAPPWEDPQSWVDNTPFLHLDRVDTPILIGVGAHGWPGEQAQAEQLFAGLRRLNRTTELRRYHGEGHSPSSWSPAAYTDFAQRILAWIEKPVPI